MKEGLGELEEPHMVVLVRHHTGLEGRRSQKKIGLVEERRIVLVEVVRIVPVEAVRIVLAEVLRMIAVGVDLEEVRHMAAAEDKGYGKSHRIVAVEVEGNLEIVGSDNPVAHIQDQGMPRSHVEVAGLEEDIDQEEDAGSLLYKILLFDVMARVHVTYVEEDRHMEGNHHLEEEDRP